MKQAYWNEHAQALQQKAQEIGWQLLHKEDEKIKEPITGGGWRDRLNPERVMHRSCGEYLTMHWRVLDYALLK
ncbi:hypothetical protein JCM19233_4442 [Vibrio astriarenae]|nr:hypothetical protein JCM19233_4442 [Vibrio sp. C7]